MEMRTGAVLVEVRRDSDQGGGHERQGDGLRRLGRDERRAVCDQSPFRAALDDLDLEGHGGLGQGDRELRRGLGVHVDPVPERVLDDGAVV